MSEWKNIKRELPKEDQQVVILTNHLDLSVGFLDQGTWMVQNGDTLTDLGEEWHVTHWTPIPKKPRHLLTKYRKWFWKGEDDD
jgi:hypothetical protein